MKYSDLKIGDKLYGIVKIDATNDFYGSYNKFPEYNIYKTPKYEELIITNIYYSGDDEQLKKLSVQSYDIHFSFLNRDYIINIAERDWNEEIKPILATLIYPEDYYLDMDIFIGSDRNEMLNSYLKKLNENIDTVKGVVEEGKRNIENLEGLRNNITNLLK